MSNPYAAPKAQVADEHSDLHGNFVPGGHGVPAGNGWNWIASAFTIFRGAPGLWIGITLLWIVGTMVLNIVPFGSLALSLVWPAFSAGLAAASRSIDQGKDIEFGDFFAGFTDRFGPLVAVGAISLAISVAVFVAVFAVMGVGIFALMSGDVEPQAMQQMGITLLLAMLIAFALLMPLAMAAWFAPLLVMFHDMGPIEAMKASFFSCMKNMLPFLVYSVVLFFAFIAACIPLGLGLLVLIPVVFASLYTAYRDIYFTE